MNTPRPCDPRRQRRGASALFMVLGLSLGLCPLAQAGNIPATSVSGPSTVLLSQSELVVGSNAGTAAFDAPGAGEVFVTLTDLDFPTSFASLQFALSDATTTLVPLTDAGTMTLDLTAPTALYTQVFWSTQGGAGLYNLTASFVPSASGSSGSPVPLPSSVASMAGGGLVLLILGLCAESFAQSRRRTEARGTVTTLVA